MSGHSCKGHWIGAAMGLVMLAVVAAGPLPARAEDYAAPTFANILKVLVRFGALNVGNNDILTNYAMITECDLYKKYFQDDFKWHQIQEAMRKAIKQDVSAYPTGLHYNAELQLDRFDFKTGIFRFADKSQINAVDYFTFITVRDNMCGSTKTRLLPTDYRIVLDQPIILKGIPVSEEDGRTLLKRMQEDKNARIIYARFNFRVVYVERLMTRINKYDKLAPPLSQDQNRRYVRMDSNLGSIDFYQDEAHTKLIYSYRP
jgi:hypothetical protein